MGTVPSGAEIHSLAPAIKYATQNVPPPTPLYVDVNDFISISALTSVAGAQVTVVLRLLRADGTIVPMQQVLNPASNRTTTFTSLPLYEGFLLGCTVLSTGSPVVRGQLFVRVILARGNAGSILSTQVLLSGYCNGLDFPSWPPGNYEPARSGQGAIRSITGTVPGAGAEITETVPSPGAWRVIAFTYSLTTSAAVANRNPTLVVDDGANTLVRVTPPAVQTASSIVTYSWAAGMPNGTLSSAVQPGPFPVGLFIDSGFRIRTQTVAMQAGDQYSAPQYLVEEWLAS